MSKYIPKFLVNKIEREQSFSSKEEKQNPYERSINEIQKEQKKVLELIQKQCLFFEKMHPVEWKVLRENLQIIFGDARVANQKTPMDFLGEHRLAVDSNYWALNKAYTDGQLSVVSSFLELIPPVAPMPQMSQQEHLGKDTRKNSLKKFLQFIKKKIKRV